MYNVSSEFLEALNREDIQHIQGKIQLTHGEEIFLDDKNLIGKVSYNRQCTSNESIFEIGQLYTGTAQVTIKAGNIDRKYLRGGTLSLKWCVDKFDWIPLGKWTITDPQRTSGNLISITAQDCISKLDVPISERYVGAISLESRMKKVTELTGVEFSQTPKEIYEIIGMNFLFGTTFCKTCREEVAAIAQMVGGFACADRGGRIVFRKFGNETGIVIPAERRHNAKLSEYTLGIRGVRYTSNYDQTAMILRENADLLDTALIIQIPPNPFLDAYGETNSEFERMITPFLRHVENNLEIPDWTSGEIGYYGNPALDLGDFIEISGGINGEQTTKFLITADYWQFRGEHTLISAGVSDAAASTSVSGNLSSSQQIIANVNVSGSIEAVELNSIDGLIDNNLRIVAEGAFSCRGSTVVFVDILANIRGISDSDVYLNVLYDGVKQTVSAINTITENQLSTVHFTVILRADSGIHKVSAEASGKAEIQRITAIVYGQGITEEQPEPTYTNEYEYTVRNNKATIQKYTGNSIKIQIPETLGGASVHTLGKESFYKSLVECVSIPGCVEMIE
ncbi:MAG: hypothetical protein K2J26_02960 [Ruminococcus sp.]|nr:hypothetical protein [Ruminococcus sp.]